MAFKSPFKSAANNLGRKQAPIKNIPVPVKPKGPTIMGTATHPPAKPKVTPKVTAKANPNKIVNNRGETLHDVQVRLGDTAKAKGRVSAELGPALAALKERLNSLDRNRASDIAGVTQRTSLSDANVKDIYDKLSQYTDIIKSNQAARFDATKTNVGNNYSGLKTMLENNYANRTADTNGELQRLGIQSVAPQATSRLQADSEYLRGLANIDAANAQSNLSGQQNAYANLMDSIQAQQAGTGASTRGDLQTRMQDLIARLSSQYTDEANSVNSKIDALRATEGPKIQELVDAFAQQRIANEQAAAVARANQAYREAQLGIQRDRLNIDRLPKPLSPYQEGQLNLGKERNAIERERVKNAAAAAQAKAETKKAKEAAQKQAKLPAYNRAMNLINGGTSAPHQRDVLNEFNTILAGNYEDPLPQGGVGAGKPSVKDQVTLKHIQGWFARGLSQGKLTQKDYDLLLRALAELG